MDGGIRVRRRDVAAIIAATYPDHRGRKIEVRPTVQVALHDLHWSGGTRSEYRACTLDGTALGSTERVARLAPWSSAALAAEGARVELPPGTAVVEHSVFCGRDMGLRVYIRPEDMPRLIGSQ